MFSCFYRNIGFDIAYKLSLSETICVKRQILFPGSNKKHIISLSVAELAHKVVKVKDKAIV